VVDARDFEVEMPPSVEETGSVDTMMVWEDAVEEVMTAYGELVDRGVPVQDARGILPTNIHTNIVAKFNLRTLHEMAKLRLCTRTQGEMQNVFRAMRDLVLFHHPWAEDFIQVQCVADGTCAFANYGPKECPVWVPALDHEQLKKEQKERFWGAERYESAPVAKGGMAQ